MTSASVGIEDARRHAEDTVRRSGTSFGAGMAWGVIAEAAERSASFSHLPIF